MNTMLVKKLLNSLDGHNFCVRYWDGSQDVYGTGADFHLLFKHPLAEGSGVSVLDPALALGEAYMRGDVEITGDMDAAARALEAIEASQTLVSRLAGATVSFVRGGLARTRLTDRQKRNIRIHYDLGDGFFSLWLDSTMSYSCAYFRNADDSLEQAQRNKMDLILRKMRLEPGMRLLDIGCGWGHMAVRAAKEYGARVLGVTLSEEQAAAARRRVEEEGVGDLVEIRLRDYTDLGGEAPFDRVLSVGMFEHIGRRNIPRYFSVVRDMLRPGGLSLLHTLTRRTEKRVNAWTSKHIFPGGYIPSLREALHELADQRFHVLHLESLRPHYARTLECWHANFAARPVRQKVQERFGESFMRGWSLYLRMAAAFLRTGGLDVHQIVFSRGVNDSLPLTLDDIYRAA